MQIQDQLDPPFSPEKYITDVGNRIFTVADKQDRAGTADKKTAMTFLDASLHYKILEQFGEIPEDVKQRLKYAEYKAVDIMKCIKQGIKPKPGGPNEELEQEGHQESDEFSSVHNTTANEVLDLVTTNSSSHMQDPQDMFSSVPKTTLGGTLNSNLQDPQDMFPSVPKVTPGEAFTSSSNSQLRDTDDSQDMFPSVPKTISGGTANPDLEDSNDMFPSVPKTTLGRTTNSGFQSSPDMFPSVPNMTPGKPSVPSTSTLPFGTPGSPDDIANAPSCGSASNSGTSLSPMPKSTAPAQSGSGDLDLDLDNDLNSLQKRIIERENFTFPLSLC